MIDLGLGLALIFAVTMGTVILILALWITLGGGRS